MKGVSEWQAQGVCSKRGKAQTQVGTSRVARRQSAGVPGGGVSGEKRVIWSRKVGWNIF